ncbi:unnamed protein product [Acanthoscelides obtectus]|nr:unnamed protein product [Acanthoscelides obtectus]CAK1642676.1 Protein bicaudal C [Acanthoscelides obtectus]
MEDTDTYITWPNRLKIGAKSKKDPHVRIAGRPEDVQAAKDRIMTILNTRCNRVTMKMDISYTDHSHIIGRGGLSIKRVMEETQCHVHFPDSNRSNPLEKSNQVSISGDIEGVENARSRVRELIPLIFGFELPIMSQNVDTSSSYLLKIQEQYKVQVMFKTRPKLHATLVLVKGVEWEVEQVKRATLLLMEFLCDNLASQIPIQMSMEISPHHHPAVLGKNHSNLKAIMKYTNCQIMFPDAQDPNIPNLKKSNINITGNILNVYKARQLLMGSLPLIIIFDLPEDSTTLRTRPEHIAYIQTNCDVTINIRQKAKQNTKACVIKGIEKNADNIYRARHLILGLTDQPVHAGIPASYHLPATATSTANSPFQDTPASASLAPPSVSPMLSPGGVWPLPATPNHVTTPTPPTNTFVGFGVHQPHFLYDHVGGTTSRPQSAGAGQYSMGSSGFHSLNQTSKSLDHSKDSTISSNSSGSVTSPGYANRPENDDNEWESALPVFSAGYHGPTVDKRQDKVAFGASDYEIKRIAGLRAMQAKPSPNSYRVPTNAWCGYGVSYTSPISVTDRRNSKDDDVWKMSSGNGSRQSDSYASPSTSAAMNMSNALDHTPNHHVLSNLSTSDWRDLTSLLTALGLTRYIAIFTTHEIDLGTFTTLTDQDLIDIGISAFGARRKILLAISEMNKRTTPFAAAPGAERSPSNSSY